MQTTIHSPSAVVVEQLSHCPVSRQRTEIVERKGIGHPDSICDAVHEQISLQLCRTYQDRFGRILHHNIDKGLLVAGVSAPRLGGGRIITPMRLVVGDRATTSVGGATVEVSEIVASTVTEWFRRHLRFVDPAAHLIVQNELRPGSMQLSDIFQRPIVGANDTSAAVGYAPLTETEQLVLEAEQYLNSEAFKVRFPESGEDVKVMGCRRDGHLNMTVAMAFVDRFIADARTYVDRKRQIRSALETHLKERLHILDSISVDINSLDDPNRGEAGLYLTVLGTSADGADGGQVGRGNRVNGLIALNRPSGNEAAAGKNPVSHVGKIYTLLTHRLAQSIYRQIPGLQEVYVWLCSRIGHPLDQPLSASVQVLTDKDGPTLDSISRPIVQIIEEKLASIVDFSDALARGDHSVC